MKFKKTLVSIVIVSSLSFSNLKGIKDSEFNHWKYTTENTKKEGKIEEAPGWLFSSFAFLATGIGCLFVYDYLRKQKRKNQEKINEKKFVSENGYDLCVICKEKTPYETSKSIEDRIGYVEGVGQLCKECKNKLEEKDYSVRESKSRYSG